MQSNPIERIPAVSYAESMPRKKAVRSKEPYTATMSKDVLRALDKFAASNEMTRSDVIELLVRNRLGLQRASPADVVAGKTVQ